MEYRPVISVIVVVYNAQAKLELSLLSVISQKYKQLELIVIDGGSNDNTVEIIKKYEKDISYWSSEPDRGIYDAMNKGLSHAKGDWVYFLGAGDILLDVLDQIVCEMTDRDTLYYGNVLKMDEQRIYDGRFSDFKLAVKNICHQAIFYPAAQLKKLGFNVRYKSHADHDLNIRLFKHLNGRLSYLPVTISVYEGNGVSAISIDKEFYQDKLNIVKTNFSWRVFCYVAARRSLARIMNRPSVIHKPEVEK